MCIPPGKILGTPLSVWAKWSCLTGKKRRQKFSLAANDKTVSDNCGFITRVRLWTFCLLFFIYFPCDTENTHRGHNLYPKLICNLVPDQFRKLYQITKEQVYSTNLLLKTIISGEKFNFFLKRGCLIRLHLLITSVGGGATLRVLSRGGRVRTPPGLLQRGCARESNLLFIFAEWSCLHAYMCLQAYMWLLA
jgi:hypothetical protein